ncbi:MAG TPA: DoxX family protein, partial [Steroidobacteraceae bacterium]|nr:DoxX family protein [Steroidobacteraceae bacterium]
MRKVLSLAPAQRFGDFTLLLLRLFVGLFLVWGVWDNVSDNTRMREFAEFLGQHGFPSPRLMAPLSAYLQLGIGLAFVLGLFTRWAGVLCAIHFVIAIAMVDHHGGMRGVFPSGCLVFIGLYLATYGAGRFSIDAALRANELP